MNIQELDLGYKEQNIKYAKGNDRSFSLIFINKETNLPQDLTDYVFEAGIISPEIDFVVSNDNPTTGKIIILISASSTLDLNVNQSYPWYLNFTVDSKVRTLLKGAIRIV